MYVVLKGRGDKAYDEGITPEKCKVGCSSYAVVRAQDKFCYLLRLTLPQNVCANNENCMGFNYDALLNAGTCYYKAALDKAYVRFLSILLF